MGHDFSSELNKLYSHHHLALCYYARNAAKKQGAEEKIYSFFSFALSVSVPPRHFRRKVPYEFREM